MSVSLKLKLRYDRRSSSSFCHQLRLHHLHGYIPIVPKTRRVKYPNENVDQHPGLARPATYQNCMMICPSHASSELQRDDEKQGPVIT